MCVRVEHVMYVICFSVTFDRNHHVEKILSTHNSYKYMYKSLYIRVRSPFFSKAHQCYFSKLFRYDSLWTFVFGFRRVFGQTLCIQHVVVCCRAVLKLKLIQSHVIVYSIYLLLPQKSLCFLRRGWGSVVCTLTLICEQTECGFAGCAELCQYWFDSNRNHLFTYVSLHGAGTKERLCNRLADHCFVLMTLCAYKYFIYLSVPFFAQFVRVGVRLYVRVLPPRLRCLTSRPLGSRAAAQFAIHVFSKGFVRN